MPLTPAPPTKSKRPGRVSSEAPAGPLPSRFTIRTRIGEGGFGIVYDAFDGERRGRVAVKTLRAPTPEHLLALKAEFRVARDLDHPNLVRLGELLEEDGRWCFTMEFVEGTGFVAHVRGPTDGDTSSSDNAERAGRARPERSFDERKLRHALRQLVRGLRALHGVGLVHRDIKPSNVLVTREGRVVILDFGLAGHLDEVDARAAPGHIAGTAHYVAPEQAAGHPAGPEADFYGVGVMLFQALTGRLPFEGDGKQALAQKRTQAAPDPQSVTPEPLPEDLRALCIELLSIDPAARPSGAELAERLGDELGDDEGTTNTATTFVGREEELGTLRDALLSALSGSAVTVVLRGEGGVGKSFLSSRFAEEAAASVPRLLVLRGRCYERELVPYKAFDGLVDELVRATVADSQESRDAWIPEDTRDLVRLFPQLERLRRSEDTPVATVGPPPGREQRWMAFQAFRDMVTALAKVRPILAILDDMQWSDEDSLALMTALLRTPAPGGLLVVMTEREGATDREPLERMLPGDVRVVRLTPLDAEDARALAVARLREAGASDSDAEVIALESMGHPLFIDELVRSSARRPEGEAPLGLDDVLRERIRGLDEQARRLLEVVALAGVPIDQAAAAEAAHVDMSRVLTLLGDLRAARLLRATGTHKPGAVETYHDRVREAVLAGLAEDRRVRIHRRIASNLAEGDDSDAEVVAMHWLGAKRPDRAAEYALRAAEQARRALAFERAAKLFRLALDLSHGDKQRERTLRRQLIDALSNAGREAEAAEERLVLATELDAAAALDERRRAAEQLLRSGHHERGVKLLLDVLTVVGITYPRSPIAVILHLLWMRLLLRLGPMAPEARATGSVDPAKALRVDVASSAGSGFSMTDNVRGAYFQSVALRDAIALGEPERLLHAVCMDICFRSTGAFRARAAVEARLALAESLAASHRSGPARAMVRVAKGFVAFFLSDWPKAARYLAAAERIFVEETVGLIYEVNTARFMLLRALAMQGRFGELAEKGEAVLRDAILRNDTHSQVAFRCAALIPSALAHGDSDAARAVERAVADALPRGRFLVPHFSHLTCRIEIFLYARDPEAALGALAEARSALRRSLLFRIESIRIAHYDLEARALLLAVSRREDAGQIRRIGTLVRRLQKELSPWAHALAKLHEAGLLAVTGQHAAARERYEAAAGAFEALGMAVHAAVARLRAAESGGTPDRTSSVDEARAHLAALGAQSPDAYAGLLAPAMLPPR